MNGSHIRSERKQDGLLAWAPLAVGVLNSYGTPTLNYGFALYFLDYRHGFVKRGLVGELFSAVSFLSRGRLLAIEYLFLAAAFVATYFVFRGVLFGTASQRRLAAALLCAPALLPHIGYLFAQPDVTLYLLVLACVALFLRASPMVAALTTCPLCCVALLAHEAFSLMFYPLIAAILLHLSLKRRLPWIVSAGHVVVFAVAFVAVMHWGVLKISPDALLAEAQARTNVGVQSQVYEVMASTLPEQRELVRRMYTPFVWRVLGLTLLLSVPYFVLLGRLLWHTMRGAGGGVSQRTITAALFASPLLLCALGHDTTRWIGAMCINATLFVLFLYLSEPDNSVARQQLQRWTEGPSFVPWLVYLIAIGPYEATGLRLADQMISAWYGP
jgi:hypothetical protein